jgi:RimJ/RimL family protein N-acetyltransferase
VGGPGRGTRAALPPAELTDGVVWLRPLQEGDAAAMAAATAEERGTYVAWGPAPGPIDKARAASFVREFGLASKKGLKTAFAVLYGHGDLVGSTLLITSAPGEAELAYWIRAAQRGRGHATRALSLTADWASRLGFHHLWLEVEPGNQASQRVAIKAGFHLSERRLCGIGGARLECLIYVRRSGSPAAAPTLTAPAAAASTVS